MPRNGAGTFSVVNPILVGALRSSADVNEDFSDMGVTEITNTIPLDGQAGMSGSFKAATAQTGSTTYITFGSDTNVGFRLTGPDAMAWQVTGADIATMDAAGKLTLDGLNVAGAFGYPGSSVIIPPQVIATSSASLLILRNTTNDANEHILQSFESGSGAGNAGTLRIVGGGANDVITMRYYIGTTKICEWTASAFTYSLDTAFGSNITADTDGYVDLTEITAPSAPSTNVARLYARDNSGTTDLFYKDGAGAETQVRGVVRQVYTSSNTWIKPGGGTQALIECWGGGGSGGTGSGADGGGGGGGGAYTRRVIALASLSASVSVTVGAGGTTATVNFAGVVGGNSSFGTYLSGFGGAGGGVATVGGGGGGLIAVGGSDGNGGTPRGFLGTNEWGALFIATPNCNAFGGGGGGASTLSNGEIGFLGGGGGGAPGNGSGNGFIGGGSVFGGGAGGGGSGNSAAAGGAAGSSVFGGNGGAGSKNAEAGHDGTAPAGGGGGTYSTVSGAGARGEVRITVW